MNKVRQSRAAMLRNREWLDEHIDEILPEYKERWIAVIDRSIVAAAQEAEEIWTRIQGREAEAVVLRIPSAIGTPI